MHAATNSQSSTAAEDASYDNAVNAFLVMSLWKAMKQRHRVPPPPKEEQEEQVAGTIKRSESFEHVLNDVLGDNDDDDSGDDSDNDGDNEAKRGQERARGRPRSLSIGSFPAELRELGQLLCMIRDRERVVAEKQQDVRLAAEIGEMLVEKNHQLEAQVESKQQEIEQLRQQLQEATAAQDTVMQFVQDELQRPMPATLRFAAAHGSSPMRGGGNGGEENSGGVEQTTGDIVTDLGSVRQKWKRVRQASDRAMIELQDTCHNQADEIIALKQSISGLQSAVTQLRERVREMQSENETAETQMSLTKAQSAQNLTDARVMADTQRTRLTAEIEELQKRLRESEARLNLELKQEQYSRRAAEDELASAKAKMANVTSELQQARAVSNDLDAELAAAQAQLSEGDMERQELRRLVGDLQHTCQQYEERLRAQSAMSNQFNLQAVADQVVQMQQDDDQERQETEEEEEEDQGEEDQDRHQQPPQQETVKVADAAEQTDFPTTPKKHSRRQPSLVEQQLQALKERSRGAARRPPLRQYSQRYTMTHIVHHSPRLAVDGDDDDSTPAYTAVVGDGDPSSSASASASSVSSVAASIANTVWSIPMIYSPTIQRLYQKWASPGRPTKPVRLVEEMTAAAQGDDIGQQSPSQQPEGDWEHVPPPPPVSYSDAARRNSTRQQPQQQQQQRQGQGGRRSRRSRSTSRSRKNKNKNRKKNNKNGKFAMLRSNETYDATRKLEPSPSDVEVNRALRWDSVFASMAEQQRKATPKKSFFFF